MQLLNRTRSNVTWVILSDFLTKATTLLTTIILARQLGVESFGIFSLSVVIASTLWPITDLGVNGYGIRRVARDKSHAEESLSDLNSARFMASIFVSLVTIAILYTSGIEQEKFYPISLGLVYLLAYATNPDWLFRGIEDMKSLFFINASISIFYLTTIFLLISSPDDTSLSSFLRASSFFIGTLIGLYLLNKNYKITFSLRLRYSILVETLHNTKHFLSNRIVSNLSQYIAFLIVSILLTDAALGLFSAPHRIYLLIIGGIGAIGSAIFPILSDVYQNRRCSFNNYQAQLIKYSLHIFVPGTFIFSIHSELIITLLFGDEYKEAGFSLLLLMMTAPLIICRILYAFTLSSTGNERYIFRAVSYGIAAQLITAILLALNYGFNGAAAALLIGEFITTALIIYKCERIVGTDRFINREFIYITLTTILLCSLSLTYSDLSNLMLSILALIAYTLLSLFTGIIPIRFLKSRIR